MAIVSAPDYKIAAVDHSVAVAIGRGVCVAIALPPHSVVIVVDRAVVIVVAGQREATEGEKQLRAGINATFFRCQVQRREGIVDIFAVEANLASDHERNLLVGVLADEVGHVDRQLPRAGYACDLANNLSGGPFAGDEILADAVQCSAGRRGQVGCGVPSDR